MLNNPFFKKSLGQAQERSLLCLSLSTVLMVTVAVALAMPVSKAQAQPTPLYAVPDQSARAGDTALAQMEVRLQQLETQIRNLTGKVEEQSYEINRLRALNEVQQQAGTEQADRSSNASMPDPLNLGLQAQQPSGMKNAVPGGDEQMGVTGQYEEAYALLKNKNYQGAREGFQTFLKDDPDHVLAANAKYWLGESYYAEGEFKLAAKEFAEGFQQYPKSAKSPDILLKLGMALAELGKSDDACVALSQIPVKFPAGPEGVLQRGEAEMKKLNCEG